MEVALAARLTRNVRAHGNGAARSTVLDQARHVRNRYSGHVPMAGDSSVCARRATVDVRDRGGVCARWMRKRDY